MKKYTILPTLFLIMIFSVSLQASAPAPTAAASTSQDKEETMRGSLHIVGNPCYLGEDPQNLITHKRLHNILDANKQPITLKPSDVVLEVHVSSQECDGWGSHFHPRLKYAFPPALLLTMLERKKEEEPVTFTLRCPTTQKLFAIELRHESACGGTLPERVDLFKQYFAEKPNCDIADAPRLLAQGVLIENPAYAKIKELQNKKKKLLTFSQYHPRAKELAAEYEATRKHNQEMELATVAIQREWRAIHHSSFIPLHLHGPNGFKLNELAPAASAASAAAANSSTDVKQTN